MSGEPTAVTLSLRSAKAKLREGVEAIRVSRKLGPSSASSYISRPNGQVAQLVEQRTENPRVGGSIPSLATKCRNILAHPQR
jgi:hypothetical protein